MCRCFLLVMIGLLGVGNSSAQSADAVAIDDSFWNLIHEPAAIRELKLSPAQRDSFQALTDKLDLRSFPLRNKSPEVALSGLSTITAEARSELKTILQPSQLKRLNELHLQQLGNRALLHDNVVARLKYSESQKQKLKEISEATQKGVAEIQKEAGDGKSLKQLSQKHEQFHTAQQKKIAAVLTPDQLAGLKTAFGTPFDLSKLGQTRFKVPELVDTGEWINSEPLKLDQCRGKVVVLHFYAFGCINCIHNYPFYREWSDHFAEKDVVLIGIHTPETKKERESDGVRRAAAEEKFQFPIVIDGKNENWNAWGNSMWPSVYVIDKQGYLRAFWMGELKWQGKDGEKYLRERIEALLEEKADKGAL